MSSDSCEKFSLQLFANVGTQRSRQTSYKMISMYVYVAFMCVSCVCVCVTIKQLTGSRKSLLDAAVSSIVQHQCLQNGGSTPGRTGMTHEGSSFFFVV